MEQRADGKYGPWRTRSTAWSKYIDGGDPNDMFQPLFIHPDRPTGGLHAQVAYVRLHNRSGGTANLGFGVRLPKEMWKAGQWTHGTTTYTDDTTDFQSTATADAPLETTSNGNGFLVQCPRLFNAISLKMQTASTGSPTRVMEYSTTGGTWTSLSNQFSFGLSSANYTSGGNENLMWWAPPADWVPMVAGHGTGITEGWYGLRVRATTAPTVAGVATSISVHRIYCDTEGVADNGTYEVNFGGLYAPLDVDGEALVAVTTFANPQNVATILFRARG